MPLSVSQDSSRARTSPSAGNAKESSTAFQGAFRAFNAHTEAAANGSTGPNGALTTRSSVGGRVRGQMQGSNHEGRTPINRQTSGQSIRSRNASPSYAAANVVASQASNRPPNSQSLGLSYRQSWNRSSSLPKVPTDSSAANEQNGDVPSPATKSLVQLYESKQDPPIQKTQSVRYVSKPGPPIRSPKPVRPLVRSTSSASIITDKLQPPLARSKPHASLNEPSTSRQGAAAAATRLAGPAFETVIDTKGAISARREPPQAPPPRRREGKLRDGTNDPIDQKSKQVKPIAAPAAPFDGATQPSEEVSTKRRSMSSVYPKTQPNSSSDSMILPLPKPIPYPAVTPSQPATSFDKPPPQHLARQSSKDHTHQLSTHMSVDSLANAMVASSLASSRAPSPTKSTPLPPPPRRHHLFHHNRSQELISRTPSPAKTMRHTMRKPLECDDEMDAHKKGKSHLVRKHQHKHHEGDRKRYRTQVTERERKRFEGVWAANRGLLLSSSSAVDPALMSSSTMTNNNVVLNVVVKDIWQRSRLPDDVLEEVWDLAVSSQETDRLGREEFVVGMWLIDQRLKGNKLPIKVSDSVWASVRRLPGIKVPRNRR